MPTSSAPPPNPQGDSIVRIVETARRMFARQGYESTTIKAIAEACGLTDAAVLYHFKSKRALLAAVLVRPDLPTLQVPGHAWNPHAVADALVRAYCTWAQDADSARVAISHALTEGSGPPFDEESQLAFREHVCEILRPHCGDEAEEITESVVALLAGVSIDLLLQHGHEFERMVQQPETQERLRELCLLPLPPVG